MRPMSSPNHANIINTFHVIFKSLLHWPNVNVILATQFCRSNTRIDCGAAEQVQDKLSSRTHASAFRHSNLVSGSRLDEVNKIRQGLRVFTMIELAVVIMDQVWGEGEQNHIIRWRQTVGRGGKQITFCERWAADFSQWLITNVYTGSW